MNKNVEKCSCGHNPRLRIDWHNFETLYSIICNDCHKKTAWQANKENVIEEWNQLNK